MHPEELKRLRERLALTQPEFAKEIGVHPMTVSKWETGARGIPGPVARLITRMDAERRAAKRKR